MTTTALAEIARLSVSERIQLAENIWDTIMSEPEELALPDTQRAELGRRLQAYRSDPQPGASWQEVRQGVQGLK